MDFPYRAEYAKSSRSGCKGCRTTIQQGDLRLAVMVQSPMFDGKVTQWYHMKCFFKKQRPKTTDDIEHFESLRVSDQDNIKSQVGVSSIAIVPDKKGKKRAGDAALKNAALKDFKIEYSKSGRATCRGCEQKILKDEIRISKKDFDTEVGKKYGGQDMWHHVTCFAQLRSELAFFECGDKLPGFKSLKKEDQAVVKKEIPAIKQEDVPDAKKIKTEDFEENDPNEKEYRRQNKIMFDYRDQLKNQLKPSELEELLEHNKQQPSKGKDELLDQLADAMSFGALKPCPKCKRGQLKFNKIGYVCTGDLTEWTKCSNVEKEPKRTAFKVPEVLKEKYHFLKAYKYVPCKRVIKEVHSTVTLKKDVKEEESEPKVKRALPSLYDMEFVIVGHPSKSKDEIKKLVTSMGGKVTTKIKESVMAVISTAEEVEKMGARMLEVERCQIHVVPDDFLDEAKDNAGKIPDLIIKKSLCNWGADPTTRVPSAPSTSSSKSKSGSRYTSSVPSKVKLKLKGGVAVDPDSGLEDVAHVYLEGQDKYTVTLGLTDIQSKKNSYYKLQLLAADRGNQYWLFRSWGRIGTTIGGNKVEPMSTLVEAKKQFRSFYEAKTGNAWEQHNFFVKVPGRMCPIDVDYGDMDQINLDIVEADSNLPKPVQDLMRLIFDINSMKKLMAEFELDMEKMPLGKLSSAQIRKAFAVLGELQQLIDSGNPDEMQLLDATNRFYTFIPHSFGVDDPPILRDSEVIKQKLEMLDSLTEMEIAYNLMKSSGSEHTVDSYYKQLNTEIDVLDRESEEFTIIQEYVTNTHAATHSSYTLEIEEVYIVKREGEDKRFKPFRKLHNHKLLWHGSRVTNFAGILSQGLRIAPPEAPVTGYMFGKGVYFADMVSKSANYCNTTVTAPTGLLLLCDVALGSMYELFHSKYIEKLPKGKHSTKGVGGTEPDPTGFKTLHDIEVPAGKGIRNSSINTSLLYNEYVVYDVAQVNVKYLLKVNFKYKY
ncbi:poly [ADP-ribose] polymerase [Anoplophora glabripennis]|uniref:poly [ADP-ribose] polymerase n=1 Tax=Anoplophora glabripennis TaxID=217634 RepID=UPI000873ABAE|nr:poly [ADP-ribose] polymerase [Anoplophora glabripennis]